MSLHGEYVIWLECDRPGCDANINFGARTQTNAIREAKRAGWRVTREQKTFCPHCKELVRKEALHAS